MSDEKDRMQKVYPAKSDQLPLMPGTSRRFPPLGMKIDMENPSWILLINDGSLVTKKPDHVSKIEADIKQQIADEKAAAKK